MRVDPTDPDQPLYGASPLTAYARFWRRYVVFSGRASLSEYWWAVLLNVVVAVVLGVVGGVLLALGGALAQQGFAVAAVPNALGAVLIFTLVVVTLGQIVPGISLSVRRLHDANLSGLLDNAESLLRVPARIGFPVPLSRMPDEMARPEFAAVIGMLLYTHRTQVRKASEEQGLRKKLKSIFAGSF